MMLCAVFTVIFASSESTAAFSTWNKGDKWALKGEKDLGAAYRSMNELFTIGNDEMLVSNLTINDVSVAGYTGVYILFEVTDVSATEYVLKITAVQNFSMASSFSGSGEFIGPGSYIETWYEGGYYQSLNPDNLENMSDASRAVQDIGYDVKLAAGVKEIAVLKLDIATMAIKSMTMEASSYARGYVNVVNYPNTTTGWDSVNERYLENITYETFDSNITLDAQFTGEITFDPAFGLLADSPAEGSSWEPESGVNITGTVSGSMDVQGLTPNIEGLIFDDYLDEAEKCGITGFPIDFAGIYSPDPDKVINNGTVSITNKTIEPKYTNLKNKTIDDPVFGSIAVNEIGWYTGGSSNYLTYYYYPAKGYIVGTQTLVSSGQVNLVLSTKSVSVADAQGAVDSISTQMEAKMTYDEVVESTKGTGGNASSDLLIIIAVAAIALLIAIGALYVLVYRRRPKT